MGGVCSIPRLYLLPSEFPICLLLLYSFQHPVNPLFTPMSQVFSFASAQCGSVRRELTEWMRAAQIPPHLCKLLCKWSGACLASCESPLGCSPPTSLKTADLTWSSDKLPHFIRASLGCHLTSLSQKLWMWSARLCVSSAC